MQDVQVLADWSQNVKITPEVKAYLHNLVVFLRLNRAVAKGISPTATKHLDLLSRYDCLADDEYLPCLHF